VAKASLVAGIELRTSLGFADALKRGIRIGHLLNRILTERLSLQHSAFRR
jgi:hypothetical protein